MTTKPEILVSLPSEGWVRVEIAHWLAALTHDARFNVSTIMPLVRPYENALNYVALAMRKGPFAYWLNMDADNPPTNNPLYYVDADKDFIGFPTPVWKVYAGRCELSINAPPPESATLQPVEWVGSGCFLVARRVIDAIRRPFERTVDEDGIVKAGPDINFCRKMRAAGFQPWCAWDNRCSHFREVDLGLLVEMRGNAEPIVHRN